MQNPKELDDDRPHGFTIDRDEFVNETPYISTPTRFIDEKGCLDITGKVHIHLAPELIHVDPTSEEFKEAFGIREMKDVTPISSSEEFIELAGHLEHSPSDQVKQDHPSAMTVHNDYKRAIKKAMSGAPKKNVWRSSNVDLSKLNIEIAEPYKVIMESAATGDFDTFSQLKKDICSYFGMAMYRFGVNNQDYMTLIYAMRALYWTAEDGGEVVIETNVTGYDYSKVFIGLNLISGKSINKNTITWRGLTMYPAINFPIHVKDDVIFQPLIKLHPDFMKLIKKNKLMLYVTSDFNLAIDKKFLTIEELTQHLTTYWNDAHYQFPNGLHLYIIE